MLLLTSLTHTLTHHVKKYVNYLILFICVSLNNHKNIVLPLGSNSGSEIKINKKNPCTTHTCMTTSFALSRAVYCGLKANNFIMPLTRDRLWWHYTKWVCFCWPVLLLTQRQVIQTWGILLKDMSKMVITSQSVTNQYSFTLTCIWGVQLSQTV